MPRGDRSNRIAVRVDAKRCVHSHSVWAICARCVNLCPAGAITLEEGAKAPHVNPDVCVSCGQCMSACPLAAFGSDDFSERQLLARVDSDGPVRLRCFLPYGELGSLSLSDTWDSYHIGTCLAALTPGVLYQLALDRPCELAVDRCAECVLFAKAGITLRRNIADAAALLADAGRPCNLRESTPLALPPLPADVPDSGQSAAGEPPNVRAMFHSVFSAVRWRGPGKRRVLALRAQSKRVPGWRVRLADGWNRVGHVQHDGAYRWPVLKVNADRCRACGICMQLCPTGSIVQAFGEGSFAYSFTPGSCADCGLCLMSCPVGALTRGHTTYAQPFAEVVCYERAAEPCPRCGMPLFTGQGAAECRLCQLGHGAAPGAGGGVSHAG